MKRIDFDDNINAVEDKFGTGKDGWTNGDPADPSSATVPQDYWFDGVQEELIGIIEAAGLTPDGGDYTQVLAGLRNLFVQATDTSGRIGPRLIWSDGPNSDNVGVWTFTGTLYFAYNCYFDIGNLRWDTLAGASNPRLVKVSLGGEFVPATITLYQGTLTAGVWSNESFVVSPATVPRVVGHITATAGSTTGAASANSIGISSVNSTANSQGRVTVSFDEPFESTDYFPFVTTQSVLGQLTDTRVYSKTASSVTVVIVDAATGSVQDLSGSNAEFYIECKGI